MTFYNSTGPLIFGTRLKRLSEKFIQDVSRLYKALKINFEPGWFPLFYLLNRESSLSMTEIAAELEITHSAVSQLVNSLKKKELLEFVKADDDKRRVSVTFTEKGAALIEQLVPVWQSLKRVMEEMINNGEYSCNLMKGLEEFEAKLNERELVQRVLEDMENFSTEGMEIIQYQNTFNSEYKKLMFKWFEENYFNGTLNVDLISAPENLIDYGTHQIFLVKINGSITGLSISELNGKSAEILFFSIDENWEWQNIGPKLLKKTIDDLKLKKIESVETTLLECQQNYLPLFTKAKFVKCDDKLKLKL